jgi:hypothetical protein
VFNPTLIDDNREGKADLLIHFESPPPVCAESWRVVNNELVGGTLPDTPQPGDETFIVGNVNIQLYQVNAMITVSPIPEPQAAFLALIGLAGCSSTFRRRGCARLF